MSNFSLAAHNYAYQESGAEYKIVYLKFEGININEDVSGDLATVLDFYNGGTSSAGTSGTDYNINFDPNALALKLNTLTVNVSNTSRCGLGDPTSSRGALFWLAGPSSIMNVPNGFVEEISFFYSSPNVGGSIQIFDGLGGTGTILATLLLGTTPNGGVPGYGAEFCPFVEASATFSGVAKSIDFQGSSNQIVFDDVLLKCLVPGG